MRSTNSDPDLFVFDEEIRVNNNEIRGTPPESGELQFRAMADDLDLKSKGRKAWGFESPSGHHVGERLECGRKAGKQRRTRAKVWYNESVKPWKAKS